MATQPSPSSRASLIIGVFSWPTREGHRRRKAIRTLANPRLDVDVRFVLPEAWPQDREDETVVERTGDIWRLPLPSAARRVAHQIGKYLLILAYLRRAAELPYAFIGRADDDALFNGSAVARQLLALPAHMQGAVVFGVSRHWYMWARQAMEPVCFAYTPRRWELQRRQNGTGGPCSSASAVGPFYHTLGPLAVYSAALVRELVADPALGADEAHAVANWSAVSAARRALERRQGVAKRREFFDDAYFSAVVYERWRERPLWLVRVPLSDYPRTKAARGPLRRGVVYHGLTSRRLLNLSGLLEPSRRLLSGWTARPPACRTLAASVRRAALHCCAQWRACDVVFGRSY